MSDSSVQQFEDLNLKIGQIVQIHPNPEKGNERFDCLLVGCFPKQALIVSAPPDTGTFPVVEEGQKVVIRIMSANGVALFPTVVRFISEVPIFMVYLEFPRQIKFRLVRHASRVDVALPILVSNKTIPGCVGITGKISDISIGGAQIELSDNVGDLGEKIELKGKFQVGEIKRVINLRATIRRKNTMANANVIYGVEFAEADEDKLLVLFGFIFNLMTFGNVQTIS